MTLDNTLSRVSLKIYTARTLLNTRYCIAIGFASAEESSTNVYWSGFYHLYPVVTCLGSPQGQLAAISVMHAALLQLGLLITGDSHAQGWISVTTKSCQISLLSKLLIQKYLCFESKP